MHMPMPMLGFPAKMGYRDVSNLTPSVIALEALQQIEGFLKEEDGHAF